MPDREIFDLFDATVCGGSDPEVKAGKPAPDVFLVAARRLSVDPAHCLVLEDAPNGAEAAAAAGMQVRQSSIWNSKCLH